MTPYRIQIKDGPRIVSEFPVMARDRKTAQKQHEGLCEPGQYVWVADAPAEVAYAHQRAAANERAAMALQINRPSELERAMQGVAA